LDSVDISELYKLAPKQIKRLVAFAGLRVKEGMANYEEDNKEDDDIFPKKRKDHGVHPRHQHLHQHNELNVSGRHESEGDVSMRDFSLTQSRGLNTSGSSQASGEFSRTASGGLSHSGISIGSTRSSGFFPNMEENEAIVSKKKGKEPSISTYL
jgi:hypothetical protein